LLEAYPDPKGHGDDEELDAGRRDPARSGDQPVVSNLYLDPLDQQMAQQGSEMCGMRMTLVICAGPGGSGGGFGTGAANGPQQAVSCCIR